MPEIKVCLIAIVKNEFHIVDQSLRCMSKICDTWVIDDTGSSDGTQDVITNFMKERNIPGRLFQTPWKDFEYNRTLNLEHAEEYVAEHISEGEIWYFFTMDADDLLYGGDPHDYRYNTPYEGNQSDLPGGYPHYELDRSLLLRKLPDMAFMSMINGPIVYDRGCFVKYNPEIRWWYEGVRHEYLGKRPEYKGVKTTSIRLPNGYYIGRRAGARSKDPDCVFVDAVEMELAIRKNEKPYLQGRYLFYTAQSYRDLNIYDRAETLYIERTTIPGPIEEVYLSWYEAACARLNRGKDDHKVVEYLIKAINYLPRRLEATHLLVRTLRLRGLFRAAFIIGQRFLSNEFPKNDILFVNLPIHHWKFLDEMALCSYWSGDKQGCLQLAERMLKISPEKGPKGKHRERIEGFSSFCRSDNIIEVKSDEKEHLKLVKQAEQKILDGESYKAINKLLRAIDVYSERVNALHLLVRTLRLEKKYAIAWYCAQQFIDKYYSIDDDVHNWMFLDEASICAYYTGDVNACKMISQKILSSNKGPKDIKTRNRIKENLTYC